MKNYACDFETSTDSQVQTYVWAWGSCQICENFEETFQYGTSILSFFEYVLSQQKTQEPRRYWFHNLKFDGAFIVDYLLSNGFIYDDKNFIEMEDCSFNTTISGDGQFYRIRVKIASVKVEFCNSLMKLQSSIKKLGEDLGYVTKGDIDYNLHREEFAEDLDPEDLEYLRRDVVILAHAMNKIHIRNGTTGLTIGSDCLNEFKKLNKNFEKIYPKIDLDLDKQLRVAYIGGYVQKKKPDTYDYGKGFICDINSMYPYVMHSKSGYKHPYGLPKHYDGCFEDEQDGYDIYIQKIYVSRAVLKSGKHWPTINVKRKFNNFGRAEYSRFIKDVELTLTMHDLYWFTYNYEVEFDFIEGWKFKSMIGIFDSYIDKWYAVKEQATKDEDESMRAYAKLMQNNLYGKLATNPNGTTKVPYLSDNGVVKYHTQPNELDPVYIPAGCFITSYARNELFKAIRNNYDIWIYCDTDCIQCEGDVSQVRGLKIDKYELGAWDIEKIFTQARYLRPKTYAVLNAKTGKWDFKCAGLPKEYQKKMSIDEFFIGSKIKNCKLVPKRVKGGIILTETDFEIRA